MAGEKATLYVCMLVLCMLEISLLALNRAVYSSFSTSIAAGSNVSIYNYLIQPDIQLYTSIFVVLIGTLLPAVSGIAFIRLKKQWPIRAQACLFVTTVIGFLCTGILMVLDVSTIGNVSHAQCWYSSDNKCFCGLAVEPYMTSVMVCGQFVVRICYQVCIGLSCIATILCLITVNWKTKPAKKKMLGFREKKSWPKVDQVLQKKSWPRVHQVLPKKPKQVQFNTVQRDQLSE